MKSKGVLVLTNSISGLHSFRKEVMKALVDAGYDLYLSYPEEDAEKSSYFKEIGCHLLLTPFNRTGMNPVKDVKLLHRYIRTIKSIKPAVVLTYTIKPNIYGGMAAALCGVHQLANITGLGDAVENPGLLRTIAVTLYKIGLSKCRAIFFQNDTNLNTCVQLGIVKRKRAHLIPGSGVNTEHHTYQEYPEDGTIKFLYIGRMKRDKGIQEYFYAASVIKSKYPNTEFQIVGTKEDALDEQLDELIKSGIINFLGPKVDVRPFIGDVHCTIMPSYHEGMSNVNLESSANGRPVITTDVPGCRETIDDGVTGFLINAKDGQDLATKVEKFILLPYEQKKAMGLAARAKVEKEFDRQIVVDAYLEAVRTID